jgi:hypothetical protein
LFLPLIIKVAAGRSHFAVVNVEKELLTWAVSLREAKYIFYKICFAYQRRLYLKY